MDGISSAASSVKPSFRRELWTTLILAAPISAGHIGQMLMGLVDTVMIGRIGVVPLAAAAFGGSLIHFVYVVGIGMMTSVSVLVSHAWGKGEEAEAAGALQQGTLLAFLVGGIICFGAVLVTPLYSFLGQPPEVIEEAVPYIWIVGSSMVWALLMVTLKNFSEAQSSPMPAFWCGLGSVLLNIFLNWIFIFGNLGFPRMELVGAGIATWIARLVGVVALFYWLKRNATGKGFWPKRWLEPIHWETWRRMWAIGFPVSIQLFIEVGTFAMASLLCGMIGTLSLAAHQIAITCAATTFMFPLGLGIAVTIRVGHVLGSGSMERARTIGLGALGFGAFTSAIFALVFYFFNYPIASVFTNDLEVISLAAGLIIIAACFQFFDATQAIAMGALRGCKDVRIPTWITFFAFWVVALPVAVLFAFPIGIGAYGVWLGLALGLGGAAIGLAWRFILITKN